MRVRPSATAEDVYCWVVESDVRYLAYGNKPAGNVGDVFDIGSLGPFEAGDFSF
ncbi:hypothetical protein [Arthrobacter bambusae]|uniref:hypothetical protein n=1 Tax=Arthrobacter bambusae TaxID=1338426 RepID=UPI002780E1E0|nr:hypothetical protein [Arthrobacter bambusae]MDQ0028796.1 hypothetical protein [Arthrobacter bambusae]MDQ0096410.1 hypothetical protein [Arthrobacter bambusae]